MANWSQVISKMDEVLYNEYNGKSREELLKAKEKAQANIQRRITESADDGFVSQNLDETIVSICDRLLDTRVERDFDGFSMEIDGMTLTYIEFENYTVKDKLRGINAICNRHNWKGKGIRKYEYEIQDAIDKFTRHIRKNMYM